MSGTYACQYRPYQSYKDSGIAWLGNIPYDFTITKLKRIALIIDGDRGNEYPNENDLTVDGIPFLSSKNITNNKLVYANLRYISEDKFLRLRRGKIIEGDLVITVRGTIGSVGLFKGENCETAFINAQMMILRPFGEISSSFLHYTAQSDYWRSQLEIYSYGSAQKQLSNAILSNLFVVLPKPGFQNTVVDFLDRKTAAIDTLIAEQRKLIDLLQEKQSALISYAVTKGLLPNVPLKNSGIPWIGQIPDHWDFNRLKLCSEIQSGVTLGRDFRGKHTVTRPYLRVANVQDGYLNLDEITYVEVLPEEISRFELKDGDVLMTEGGDFDKLGRGYVWECQIPGCLHQNHVFSVRLDQRILSSFFLAYVTSSAHGKNYFTSISQQTTNLATINQTKLNNFPLPIPPLNEQKAIVDYLDDQNSKIGDSVTNIQSGIELLQEYRTAMISAAVTGKIDVRDAI